MSERHAKETPCQRAMVKDICFYGFRRGRQTFFYGFRRWFFNGFRRGRKRFLMVSVAERFLMVSTFFNGFRR